MNNCSHVLVQCIDFRTQTTVDRLTEILGIRGSMLGIQGCFDRVSISGGAGNFPVLESQLTLSRDRHHSSKAILTIHEDCGAGARENDLAQAVKIASKLGFQSRCFVILLNGTWREIKTG